MTTADTGSGMAKAQPHFRLPDPERRPEDMTSFNHLALTGSVHHLIQHLGNPDTTLVAGEHFLVPEPVNDLTGVKYPDLLIAFNVDPAAYYRSNSYVVSQQGKPPDFVLEIASPSTRREDMTVKRDHYASLGIPEYWRFDETPSSRRSGLAGDRLAAGAYQPLQIEELAEGVFQGYSEVLGLYIRWEQGQLRWHDPSTGQHILTYDDHRDNARRERENAIMERDNVRLERENALRERESRIQAEARIQELEEEINRLRNR